MIARQAMSQDRVFGCCGKLLENNSKRGVDQMKRRLINLLICAVSLLIIVCGGSSLAVSSEDVSTSCVAPARGPILAMAQEPVVTKSEAPSQPAQSLAKVGASAPDFEANAFIKGEFKNIKLSEFKGKWVLVCFYPGDFTFV